MYSTGVTMRQQSRLTGTPQPATKSDTQLSFASELATALQPASTRQSEQALSLDPPARNLSAVDSAVQRDIQAAFGIEPHKPGSSLKPLMESSWTFKSSKPGTITTDDMENNVATASEIFQKHLSRFIIKENVSTRPPIELNISGDGSVKVQDGHPDKAKIEEFINGNHELRNLYAGISSTKSFIASSKEAIEFQKRYAVDPKAAVAEFAHLFSGNYSYSTRLVISDEGWDYQTTSGFKV